MSRRFSSPRFSTDVPFSRREVLAVAAMAFGFGITAACGSKKVRAAQHRTGVKVKIAEFDENGKPLGVQELEKVEKTDEEWRDELDSKAFEVARKKGTEWAFSGKLNKNYADGLYRCVCCGTALFDSHTKYDSGSGWPSFWEPIAKENVLEESDTSLGMERTEVECARCNAHLGHVFDDGPEPTQLRYCMNSASLKFVPRGAKEPSE